jgi:hypothetical protein
MILEFKGIIWTLKAVSAVGSAYTAKSINIRFALVAVTVLEKP